MQAHWSDVEVALSTLRSGPLAIPAQSWPGKGEGNDRPGLYSWWVGEAGATELSTGLGAEIGPGLIYAGQAGATSWPSGKRYGQTLHGRIGKNHIAGAVRHSTLRRTLAACLVPALDLKLLSGTKPTLALDGERRLTEWIRAQLSVVLFPFDDRDRLGSLEGHILEALDPPLNLDGMRESATRASLRLLRGQLKMQVDVAAPTIAVPKEPSESRKRQVRPRGVTLHEEIADILRGNGNEWMTMSEVAHSVNNRDRYQKLDGSEITSFQIHGRTRNHGELFERDGSRVRLIS